MFCRQVEWDIILALQVTNHLFGRQDTQMQHMPRWHLIKISQRRDFLFWSGSEKTSQRTRTWELTLRENLNNTDRKKKYKPKCGKWPSHLVRAKFAITFTCWWGHQPNEAKNKNGQNYRASKKATMGPMCCAANVQCGQRTKVPLELSGGEGNVVD